MYYIVLYFVVNDVRRIVGAAGGRFTFCEFSESLDVRSRKDRYKEVVRWKEERERWRA